MLKIAYIIPNIEIGGTEKHLLSLIKKIDKKKFSPILITIAGGGKLYNEFKNIIPVYIFEGKLEKANTKLSLNPLNHLKTILKIAKQLKKEKVNIVHCYLPAANCLGPISAKFANINFTIVSKRSLSDYKKKYPLVSKFENLGNYFSDKILANSIAVKKEIEKNEKFWENKIEIIYNGVEIPLLWEKEKKDKFKEMNRLKRDSIYAICVSNFFKYKGHEELIHAAHMLKNEIPQLEYLLIGRDAENLKYIKELIQTLKLSEKVHLLGEVQNVYDLLQISDIYIHPSHQEGFSNSILEAMACSLPVIACNVGGNSEIVTHQTGKLVSPKDPHALALAIKEIVKEKQKMLEMGKNARLNVIKNFSIDKMVKKFENLYLKHQNLFNSSDNMVRG